MRPFRLVLRAEDGLPERSGYVHCADVGAARVSAEALLRSMSGYRAVTAFDGSHEVFEVTVATAGADTEPKPR